MLRIFPVLRSNTGGLQCLFDAPWVKAVNHLLSVIKDDQRHNVTVKVVVPFTVKTVILLNIPCFKKDVTCGEKTFRLGTVASAISYKDDNPFT